MEEKEYVVGVHKDVDLSAFEAEMTASTGAGPIPQRSVSIANPRLGSKRMTHFMLTQEEVENLKSDPRVMFVEIPAEQNPLLSIGFRTFSTGNFTKTRDDLGDNLNWGLKRCINKTNIYADQFEPPDNTWYYALDGRGVDIVIQDSGVEPNHPEWQDENGNSRYVSIDWYQASGLSGTQSVNHDRDHNGHGTHCAGIAAGKTFGWAKGARIYSQKLLGLEIAGGTDGTGISMTDAFDAIRLWHISKNGSRPTVVNMSWGYGVTVLDANFDAYAAQINGTFQGNGWSYTDPTYNTRDKLWTEVGFPSGDELFAPYFSTSGVRIGVRVPDVDLEIEEMIDAGIHVCIASGNDFSYMDVPNGDNYDNEITVPVYNSQTQQVQLQTISYHRGSSPYSQRAYMVGNVADGEQEYPDGVTSVGFVAVADAPAISSNYGPGVNIWAPGTNIKSACSNTNEKNAVAYYANNSYKQVNISGTSMASPQVAGVVALFSQLYKNFSPQQIQDLVFGYAQPAVQVEQQGFNTGDLSDYNASLGGGENRYLYFPYGNEPIAGLLQGNFVMSASLRYE